MTTDPGGGGGTGGVGPAPPYVQTPMPTKKDEHKTVTLKTPEVLATSVATRLAQRIRMILQLKCAYRPP